MTLSARRIATDSALFSAAGAIGKGAALFSVPIMTRVLGADGYGVVDLAASFSAFFALVGRFGGEIPVAAWAPKAATVDARRALMGTFVAVTGLVSLGISVLLIPATPAISQLWGFAEQTNVVTVALALIPLNAVRVSLLSVVRLEGRAGLVATVATVDLLAQMTLSVTLVLLGFGPAGAIMGYLLGATAGALIAMAATRKYLKFEASSSAWRRMFAAGIPYLPAFVAFVLADQIARFMIVDELGQAAVGQFALALRIASVISLAVSAFSFAWAPAALQMRATERTGAIVRRALAWYLVCALFASMVLGAFSPEVVAIMGGQAFAPAAVPTAGLAWAAALGGAFFMLVTAAGITSRGSAVAIAALGGALVQLLVLGAALAPLGLASVGGSAVAGRTLACLLLIAYVRDFLPGATHLVVVIIAGSALQLVVSLAVDPAGAGTPIRLAIGTSAALALAISALVFLVPRFRRARRAEAPDGAST